MKKIVNFLVLALMLTLVLFCFSGCSDEKNNKVNIPKSSKTTNTSTNTSKNEEKNIDYKANAEKQMQKPNQGDTVAILHVKKFGDIKVRFFSDIAPKAVENFVTHAKNGYYNGLTFHRVMEEFMIQGGDPEGNGSGGESIWGTGFGTELDESLVPYRGALCMAMSSLPNSIGSQFFIVQANYDQIMEDYMKMGGYPEGLIEQYKNYGGYMSLYMNYTVFGQVYEGIEVVDAITKVKKTMSSTGEESVPVEDVIIESIEVSTYSE